MGLRTRCIRIVSSFAALCVLAAAAPALATDSAIEPAAASGGVDLSGRWQGRSFILARRDSDCSGKRCVLTLDIMKCATGWCGVEVLDGEARCGATALRLDAGTTAEGTTTPQFRGNLELAKGTEPYVVEAYLVSAGGEGTERELQIAGDTGGEFRMFRRSFPFNATLVRAGEPSCRPESAVSLLN